MTNFINSGNVLDKIASVENSVVIKYPDEFEMFYYCEHIVQRFSCSRTFIGSPVCCTE